MKQRKFNAVTRTVAVVIGALGIGLGSHAATSFTPNSQPTGYIAPVALSTDWLMVDPVLNPTGGGKLYRPWFENGYWQGDLIEYDVLANGDFSTSIDLSTAPPGNTGSNWSARLRFDTASPYDPTSADSTKHSPTYWDVTRKVITTSLGNQVAFRWANLTSTQKGSLDSLALTTDSYSETLDYVRGQRDYESANPIDQALGAAAWEFRDRRNLLGDIQHSNPVYVAAPKAKYNFDGYGDFKTTHAARAARVYVGANDGMLHVFDATTGTTKGDEVYAYIPSMVLGNLGNLTRPSHTYFVDGPLSVGDAYVGSAWKTVLVGGLGAGGKGVFALDITTPTLSAETAATGNDKKVMWEISADSDNDLGYTYSRAVIARLNDNKWYAVMGNGYVSANGIAMLYLVDIATGAVTKISTASGSAGSPNGLSSPALVDIDGDFKVDYAYAGDIDGNMWKFNLSSTTPSSWALGYKLYGAGAAQAITTAPDLVYYKSGYLIYFGTGRVLTTDDVSNTDVQSVYAVHDRGTTTVTSGELVTQVITEATYDTSSKVRWATNNTIDWTTKKGWKIDLPAGERIVTQPLVRAERLQVVTTSPNPAGQPVSWLVEPNYLTGGPPNAPVIDMNRDGNLTTADNVDGNGNSSLIDAEDRVMALKLGEATMSQPVFAVIDEVVGVGTMDTIFINQLQLPIVETCTTDCVGGFYGGHIDVDTDSPLGGTISSAAGDLGLGNKTDGHQHEYDKVHGVVYVDVLGPSSLTNATSAGVVTPATSRKGKLEPRRGLSSLNAEKSNGSTASQSLNSVEEVTNSDGSAAPMPGSKKFIVAIANADLSTGGTITIGMKADGVTPRSWDVVTYQNMLTAELDALGVINGSSASVASLTDDDGDSLLFTLDDIKASDGTLRISFTNKAIIEGGLHPTITGCVKGDKNPYDSTSATTTNNMHITEVPTGASKDPSADQGYRWRNGALTLQLLDASGFTLQDKSFLPQTKTGTLVGGVYAKKFTAVTKSGGKVTGFTLSEGPNESGMLYESTLFWHYGDLVSLRKDPSGSKAVCYGSSTWQSAVNIERGGLTLGEYNAKLAGLTDDSPQIEKYAAALSAFNTCLTDASCYADETKLKALEMALYDAILPIADYVKYRGYAPGHIPDQHLLNIDKTLGSGSGTGSGSPPNGTDNTQMSDLPDTTGPNYQRGRRTWTDLTPKN